MAAQDSNKKAESTSSKTGSKSSKSEAQSEKPQAKEETEGQGEEQQTGEETGNTLLQVLNFLKNSNLINLDMPLKSLFDQAQNIQTDPSTEWGLIGDSGHWALVWQKKHD
ncbi:hypothetical protein [Dictyobacter aurantiacus]|uniref:Uncharacterized protein n=1 Tax=Dictyobacter aurantiacus TaxID=1936993 RepID=A0A401ZGP1_9CHLR|nr:hypothetical protein [Dictyobacter aurantiacus]GCE06054.1 hypothetical protein KDAU_33830 [Dictyobacter aurantiacus]